MGAGRQFQVQEQQRVKYMMGGMAESGAVGVRARGYNSTVTVITWSWPVVGLHCWWRFGASVFGRIGEGIHIRGIDIRLNTHYLGRSTGRAPESLTVWRSFDVVLITRCLVNFGKNLAWCGLQSAAAVNPTVHGLKK